MRLVALLVIPAGETPLSASLGALAGLLHDQHPDALASAAKVAQGQADARVIHVEGGGRQIAPADGVVAELALTTPAELEEDVVPFLPCPAENDGVLKAEVLTLGLLGRVAVVLVVQKLVEAEAPRFPRKGIPSVPQGIGPSVALKAALDGHLGGVSLDLLAAALSTKDAGWVVLLGACLISFLKPRGTTYFSLSTSSYRLTSFPALPFSVC